MSHAVDSHPDLYLRRLGDFVVAQLFHPDTAAELAGQVLIPLAVVPCGGRATPTVAWVSVEQIVHDFGQEIHDGGIYEVYMAELLHRFQRSTAPWPTLWREAMTLHCYRLFGVDFTDEAHLAALDDEAYEAKREAYQAMYGEPSRPG